MRSELPGMHIQQMMVSGDVLTCGYLQQVRKQNDPAGMSWLVRSMKPWLKPSRCIDSARSKPKCVCLIVSDVVSVIGSPLLAVSDMAC